MKLVIEEGRFFQKYAVVNKKELIYLEIIEKDESIKLDDIFYGEVQNVVKGLNAAFINIGVGVGFLPLKEEKLLKGQKILVQVAKEGNELKKAKLSTDITIKGNYVVLLPNENEIKIPKKINSEDSLELLDKITQTHKGTGMILRTKAFEATFEAVSKEISELSQKYSQMAGQTQIGLAFSQDDSDLRIEELIYKYNVKEVVTNNQTYYKTNKIKYFKKNVELKMVENFCFNHNGINLEKLIQNYFKFDGFNLSIEKTEAMTVVDVDSGYIDNNKLNEAQIYEINKSAISKTLEIIKLMNMGGIIIIDLINTSLETRTKLNDHVSSSIKNHGKAIKASKITKNNLLEIIRQKTSISIVEKLTQKCETCNGSGRTNSNAFILDDFEIQLKSILSNQLKKSYSVFIPENRYEHLIDVLKEIAKEHDCELVYLKSNDILNNIKIIQN
ncbi:MAG: ribonuclease E/G [Proteocatella sp.]